MRPDRNQERFHYSNRYGSLDVVPYGDIVSINSVRARYSLEDTRVHGKDPERIVLITENRHVMPSFIYPLDESFGVYFIIYYSSNEVRYVRIENLKYVVEGCPIEELNREVSHQAQAQFM